LRPHAGILVAIALLYDLDFCRQAEAKNLKMGTGDISVVHASCGEHGTDSWIAGYQKYLDKWEW
jgi:hypothetical protein